MVLLRPICVLTWVTRHIHQEIPLLWHQLWRLALSFFIILSLSSCVKMNDPEVSQEYNHDIVGTIDRHNSFAQSIEARRGRLNGISIWLTTPPPADKTQISGQLIFKLYASIIDDKPIYATSLPILPTWQNSQIDLSFPVQQNSYYKSYYLHFETSGSAVQLHGRNEDVYPQGTAFADGIPIATDLAFRSTYDYDSQAIFQDLLAWSSCAGLLLPLAASLILPGWILLDITGLKRRYLVSEQLALSVGLSLAITPILMLWTTIFHIHLSRISLFWILGFIAGFSILRFLIQLIKLFKLSKSINIFQTNIYAVKNKSQWFINISLLVIIAGTFFVRLAMVRDLATPAWVDSVHHAMITKLIIQNGSFPTTYAPYMDFNVFNYHVGFHSNLAVFTLLSGLDISDSLLIYGQAINSLAPLAVFLLTITFTRKPLAGLFAALITGFLTPMPAYYTSWGRYTQLAGLIILPTFVTLIHPAILSRELFSKNKTINYRSILLVVLSISGLFLVHYRVNAFALLILVSELLIRFPLKILDSLTYLKNTTFFLGLCFLGSIFLISPWFFPSFSQVFVPKLSPPDSTAQAVFFGDFPISFLTSAYGKQSLILLGLGFFWFSIKNTRLSLTLFLWVTILLFFANFDALSLPGGGFITGTSVVIMLFMPISLIGGYFLDELVTSCLRLIPDRRFPLIRSSFWIIVVIGTALVASFGARQLIPIINPNTILSRQADRDAIDWVKENLNPNSKVLINPFSWGFGLYAGNDGGYWISPLTGIQSVPPPALYGLGNSDYVQEINSINQIVVDPNTSALQLHSMMGENQIDYLFLGGRGGPLSNSTLVQSNLFAQLYDSNGVRIYKIR